MRIFKRPVHRIENRPAFLGRLSLLIQEGYTFHDGLVLLMPHHSKQYNELLTQTERDLKNGLGVTDVLRRLGFSSNILLPVIISEVDGRLADALKGIAERLKQSEERKKKLRNLLLYPVILFFFLAIFLLVFRSYFLPNLQAMSVARNEAGTGFVSLLPLLVSKIPDVMLGLGVFILVTACIGNLIYRRLSPSGKIRFLLPVPFIGPLFSKWKTREFAGEVGSLLHSGLSMQDSLEVLVEQEVDPILGEIAKTIKEHVIYGENFDTAILLTVGLRKELCAYAKHGSDTGHLGKELLLFSENLHDMIEEEMARWLALLQPILFAILAVCILAAYLALLLPVYSTFNNF
ncbi:competence type IV pilus assembly protein ComGB [Sporosarcina luteola]|uniref:competence type IV pilus assembly protein ComGB n=1 Tax=Sporosarcina luteola TaxID=582850 RepID=UPI002041D113|nr:competence type IV pilus assembly protein ComGB [Sporosarcina luteola]MCM3710900.1 type II secretion system F family protein [Sporosarcina luteola]